MQILHQILRCNYIELQSTLFSKNVVFLRTCCRPPCYDLQYTPVVERQNSRLFWSTKAALMKKETLSEIPIPPDFGKAKMGKEEPTDVEMKDAESPENNSEENKKDEDLLTLEGISRIPCV